jgi:hypothetical protein
VLYYTVLHCSVLCKHRRCKKVRRLQRQAWVPGRRGHWAVWQERGSPGGQETMAGSPNGGPCRGRPNRPAAVPACVLVVDIPPHQSVASAIGQQRRASPSLSSAASASLSSPSSPWPSPLCSSVFLSSALASHARVRARRHAPAHGPLLMPPHPTACPPR